MFSVEDTSVVGWKPATEEERAKYQSMLAEKKKQVVCVRGSWCARVRYALLRIPMAFLALWRKSTRTRQEF